jgi:hypothetical protein
VKLAGLAKYLIVGTLAFTPKDSKLELISFSEKPVYNKEVDRFVGHPGGLNEGYLNHISAVDRKVYTSDYYIEVFHWADSLEKNQTWIPIGDTARMSQKNTYAMAIENIDRLYDLSFITDPSDEYVPLKNMMDTLDMLYYKNLSQDETLAWMYEYMSTKLKGTNYEQEVRPIAEIAAGKSVNCADVTAMYYSVLSYYGFKTSMRFGIVKDKNYKDSRLHAWITVDTKDGRIDLDPSWYPYFTPLDERSMSVKNWEADSKYVNVAKKRDD